MRGAIALIAAAALAVCSGYTLPRAAARPAQRAAVMMDASAALPEALKSGDVVPCTILEKTERGYQVEIGAARPALLPMNEVVLKPNATSRTKGYVGQGFAELAAGEVFEGQVLAVGADGAVNVSLARVQRNVAWRRVSVLAAEDVTFPATVLRFGEAGATVAVEGLPAFLPWSHWQLAEEARTSELLGSALSIKFLEAEPAGRGKGARDRLVVSHRRVRLEEYLAGLEPGQVVEGSVGKLLDYGAVVKLADGIEGLLHISQLSQSYVKNVSEVLALGDALKCVVIKIDAKDGSVALSTKMLEATPGEILTSAKEVFARARVGPRDRRIEP